MSEIRLSGYCKSTECHEKFCSIKELGSPGGSVYLSLNFFLTCNLGDIVLWTVKIYDMRIEKYCYIDSLKDEDEKEKSSELDQYTVTRRQLENIRKGLIRDISKPIQSLITEGKFFYFYLAYNLTGIESIYENEVLKIIYNSHEPNNPSFSCPCVQEDLKRIEDIYKEYVLTWSNTLWEVLEDSK